MADEMIKDRIVVGACAKIITREGFKPIESHIKSNQIIIYSRYRDTTYCDTNVLAGEP
jgi:hypothetical protein